MTTAQEKTAATGEPGAGHGVLAEPEWLEAHLSDPSVRVVEVDVGRRAYDEWHIDGAVLWDVYTDLKDADYRLADAAAVARLVARCGIRPDSTVVFYGYAPALGLWLMKLYGHADVRILNCSRDAWRAEGRPWSRPAAEPAPTGYILRGQNELHRASQTAVAGAIGGRGATIIDVRSEAEYRGERFWPSGGMEPGAGPATSLPRSTSPSTASTTTAGRSAPPRISAGSSRPSTSTATAS